VANTTNNTNTANTANNGQGSEIARYSYDPFGRRIKKTVSQNPTGQGSPGTTLYFYADEGLIAEVDGSPTTNGGNIITTYGWMPITSEYLYETCATVGETEAGLIPHFDCESYVYGVLDSHVAIRDGLPLRRRSCFPKDIQAWRVLNEIEADVLGKNGAGNAGDAIIRALVQRYPCQERSGKSK
jgi:YD repeat-containing protein